MFTRTEIAPTNDNPLKQTPLHRVAINRRWHAYYALAEKGANGYLPDSSGTSARDYRLKNGMSVFNKQEQQQIRQDLFRDKAPEAEAFINAVNSASGDCCIS